MMQKKTKIIWEISIFAFLTLLIYPLSGLICVPVLDYCHNNYGSFKMIIALTFIIPLLVSFFVKNTYIRIALIYMGFFISAILAMPVIYTICMPT
jgi:hypothetical protein